MSNPLAAMKITRKSGAEAFRCGGEAMGLRLVDFWQWATSDLVNNATRGILAEFIVASAIGAVSGARAGWDAVDLVAGDLKIEVKSAAYLQSWFQKKYSEISFGIRETREWNAVTGEMAAKAQRQADVYVFCLLDHKEKATVDPLNLDQWRFFVVRTGTLNEAFRGKKMIRLDELAKLGAVGVAYGELGRKIRSVGAE